MDLSGILFLKPPHCHSFQKHSVDETCLHSRAPWWQCRSLGVGDPKGQCSKGPFHPPDHSQLSTPSLVAKPSIGKVSSVGAAPCTAREHSPGARPGGQHPEGPPDGRAMFLTRPRGFGETPFIGRETEAQSHLPTKLQMKI